MKLQATAFEAMFNCVTTEGKIVGHVQISRGDEYKPLNHWSAYVHVEDGDIFIGYAPTPYEASELIPH